MEQCKKCKKKGHIAKNCLTKQDDKFKDDKQSGGKNSRLSQSRVKRLQMRAQRRNQQGCRIGIGSENLEAGMYVRIKLNGEAATFLVDTGASLSLLSAKLYDNLPHEQRPQLDTVSSKVLTAASTELPLKGKGSFKVEVAEITTDCCFTVAELSVDGVFGMDFLKRHEGVIDVTKECLTLRGMEIPLVFQGPVGCYRIIASETVTILPRSELVFEGKTIGLAGEKAVQEHTNLGVLEPSAKFLDSQRGFVARALVSISDAVPLRVMNLSDLPQRIYAGTEIAEMSEVSRVLTDDGKRQFASQDLSPELKALLNETAHNLTLSQMEDVEQLLRQYSGLFATKNIDLGRTSVVKHNINTGDARPVKQPLRRIPANMTEEVNSQIDEMLSKGVIEPSTSPWASNIVLVKKKDGSTRICIDYRRLNAVTEKDAYPLPRIDEVLDQLAGNAWFSTLDLFTGYWQVEVDAEDRPKTAFTTRKGLFQFRQMPFGLCSAPATFQRLMETVLAGKQWEICLVYLDDVIVYGESFEQMLKNLQTVFDCLAKAGLKLKPKKCTLFAKEVRYLGHVVSQNGVSTDPDKISAVQNWPVPVSVKEVRSFLGLCGYYRRYIQGFAAIAKCLHRLTEKGRTFIWNQECQIAFETLKSKLVEAPILAHPDFTKPFILDTDASLDSIGGVLSQEIDGRERVIAYGSRVLSKTERRYCVTKRELLAIVFFVSQFRHYLYGRKFKIRTDHGSLR